MPFPKNSELTAPSFKNSNPVIAQSNDPPVLPDYTPVVQGFVPFANRIILKRDETTPNHPCPEDLAVGELVLNAMTGNLYTKLVSGQVVYYPGTMVCISPDKSPPSSFGVTISVPETFAEEAYTISLHGITLSTKKTNELRFNPIMGVSQGLPASFSLSYAPTNAGPFVEIARVTILGDYLDTNFEFVYKEDKTFKALRAKFKVGLYDNKSVGFLKVEAA